MRKILPLSLLIISLAFCSNAATEIIKISAFPNTETLNGTDLFLLTLPGVTNKNITWDQLRAQIGTNGSPTQIITNLTVNNIGGSNAYFTNLFLIQNITNYFLFPTNIYLSYPFGTNNGYISNYFQTNVFLDPYMSNFFTTNQVLYLTNIYQFSTNLTVNAFYKSDSYVSNFFQTNIFIVDQTTSNFFETNLYTTLNISSNYTFQYSLNPTNLTMYGHTFMLGYEGDPNPTLILLGQTNEIFIDAGLGVISLSGQYFGSSFQQEEVVWGGPTNSINPAASDYFYTASTPCSITGFDGNLLSPSHGWSGLLTITNAASTNILLTLPSGMTIPERTNQVAISNASRGMISMKWSHKSGTNGVFRQF